MFKEDFLDQHMNEGYTFFKAGLLVDSNHNYLGASTDGFISKNK